MSQHEELTPEEKLLRLIRQPGKRAAKDKVSASDKDSTSLNKNQKTVIDEIRLKDKEVVIPIIRSINFSLVNRSAAIMLVLIIGFISYDLFMSRDNLKEQDVVLSQKVKNNTSVVQNPAKPFSYYQETISKRNLFDISAVEPQYDKVIPNSVSFKEMIKDIHLIGIVQGQKPQVIIEDVRLGKTYFLNKGDLLGEIKIEEIYSDRAILGYKGEKISIFL